LPNGRARPLFAPERLFVRGLRATSGWSRSPPSRCRSGRSWRTSANRSNRRACRPSVARRPTGPNWSRSM